MHPNFRLFVYFLGFILAAVIAVKPYNLFCGLTNKCEPFFFAYILPRSYGVSPIRVNFEITNFRENLVFETSTVDLETGTNRINKVKFHVKNDSPNIIEFQPKLFIEPEYISKFIERFQCLCTRKYKLRPNEEMDLQMVFAVKGGFIEASNYVFENYKNNPIKLRYQVE
jgi:cytochrome c oxidase assembly protein Cox11